MLEYDIDTLSKKMDPGVGWERGGLVIAKADARGEEAQPYDAFHVPVGTENTS